MHTRFLLNARSLTLPQQFYERSRAGGFLFPPDPPNPAVASALAGTRRFVLADNGAFDDIGRLAGAAPEPTTEPEWVRVQDDLREAAARVDVTAGMEARLAADPDALIGSEDITLAVWLRAGVPERLLRLRRRELEARNRAVASHVRELREAFPRVRVLAVASAHDYDSARDAGEVFGSCGVGDVAMGFGAFMADDSWTDEVKVDGRVRRLSRRLPTRYLRTALVGRGFFDGYSLARASVRYFHFLGLGAPIIVPIAALAAAGTARLTFDATSPIKDAVSGSLYTSRPAPLTIRTWNVAERLAAGEFTTWSCPCGFCTAFLREHPFDLPALRAAVGGARLSAADLATGRPAGRALPLFGIGRDPLGVAAENARIGHNHWVLGSLTRSIHATPDLEAFVADRVERYEAHAGAPHFGEAVRLAAQLANPKSAFWT